MIAPLDLSAEGPLFVHCDARRTAGLASGRRRIEVLEQHSAAIRRLANGRPIWIPTFNYDYCRTGVYDIDNDKSQVGPITEAERSHASWRTAIPVFNACGHGPPPQAPDLTVERIDPFGPLSMFAALAAADGTVLWYGAPFRTTTLIHHVERISGKLAYRYDKIFNGTVSGSQFETPQRVSLQYHVRPASHALSYRWDDLERHLADAGVIVRHDATHGVSWAPADALVAALLEMMGNDGLGLLTEETAGWVATRLDQLGRPFEIGDFE